MTRQQHAPRRKAAPEQAAIYAPSGQQIHRRYKLEYWFDLRRKDPTPYTRGFPGSEDTSVEAAGRRIMRGLVAKIQCTDRTQDRVVWTLVRGPRVLGTPLYSVLAYRGHEPTV